MLNHRICEQVVHGALDLLGRHLGLNLISQRNPNVAYLDAVVGGKHAAHAVAARVGQALQGSCRHLDEVNGRATAHRASSVAARP